MRRRITDHLIDLIIMQLCIVVVLSALLILSNAETSGCEAEATTEPVPSPCADVVVLAVAPEPTAVPEPSPMPEPSPSPEPDKPAYDPAIPLSEVLQLVLREACAKNGVELALALGVIEVESRFQPDADNGLCYGLMQLNRRYFPADLPPGENIRAGVEYLGQLLVRYGTVEAALTAYNAGHDTGARGYANAVLAAAERWRAVEQAGVIP